jgi:hypothetical protein
VIERIARNTAISCVVAAALAYAWTRDVFVPLGVLGGGVLIGLSFWAITGTVDALITLRSGPSRQSGKVATADGETPAKSTGLQLVKLFTRHGMLALAAYGMMVRLHLDPLGLLVGVSSIVIAAAVEVLRDLRWRRFP